MPFEFAQDDDFFVPPSPHAIGNMGESLVVKDLIRQRFYVYVPVLYRSPCDMIILKGAQTLRVEVKTSATKTNYPHGKHARFDILAQVMLRARKVKYTPAPQSLILPFDPQIERCPFCGDEQARTTDLSQIPCPCPGSISAMHREQVRSAT